MPGTVPPERCLSRCGADSAAFGFLEDGNWTAALVKTKQVAGGRGYWWVVVVWVSFGDMVFVCLRFFEGRVVDCAKLAVFCLGVGDFEKDYVRVS